MFFIFYLYTGFSIKNISVLNKHNFGPNRRTRIQENEIWSTKCRPREYLNQILYGY